MSENGHAQYTNVRQGKKMPKMIIMVLMVLATLDLHACVVPRSGPELDELIEVTETSDDLTYTFSVPANLHGAPNDATVALAYARKNENGLYVEHEYEEIQLRKVDAKLFGEVRLRAKKAKVAYIAVQWPPYQPGMCGTVADKVLMKF